ncbi:hypothetical protein [Pseudooctadecabacter sp.]|uniref:hypothetical protein n=1 Tax=Pseudooctadecabacter sp. TaxID=1966338 RepID=UPI0025FB1297|nr:hypothetical protein [Pseudooctadecabacter sp.]
MILSRTLARARIARGDRPGWAAAWGPVAFDAACLVGVFLLAYGPFRSLVDRFDMPVWAVVTALLALGFIPAQAVLIFSSLWAAKSRFSDEDGNQT